MNVSPQGISIFVADDDQDDHLLLSEALHELRSDITIQNFENGRMVIDCLNNLFKDDYPSLILLDYNMPFITGIEALKEIKKNAALENVPVVMWSTSNNQGQIDECMQEGANFYYEKPDNYTGYRRVAADLVRLALKDA